MTTSRQQQTEIQARFAADPAAFVLALQVRAGDTLRPFRDVAATHQHAWLATLAPMFLALSRGERPKIGRAWMEATKGSGKDHILAALCIWLLAFSRRLIDGQVAAADKDQADELAKSAKTWLSENDFLRAHVEVLRNVLAATRASESRITIIAADVAGSHGARPDLLIVNEAHAVTRWEFVSNLLDNASKVPSGVVIVATNAGFVGSDAWKLREMARTSSRWQFHQFTSPAPWLDEGELEEARRRNSNERFLRLFRGVWSRGNGDALDAADVEGAVNKNLAPFADREILLPDGKRLMPTMFAGLDLGIKHDRSSLVGLAAVHDTRRVRLAAVESWKPSRATGKVNLEEVEAAVLAAHRRFQFSKVLYDPWQAELMAQRLRRQNVPMAEMVFSGGNLNLMATTLLEVFRSKQIDLYDCPQLVADLLRLTIVEKSYGHKLESTRDSDGHADSATALAIALPATVAALSGHGPTMAVDHAFWRADPFPVHSNLESWKWK